MGAQLLRMYLADVYAIEQYLAMLDFIKSQQQVSNCRLARTSSSDKSNFFAGFHNERDIFQHPIAILISEPDIPKLDSAMHRTQAKWVFRGNGNRFIQ